MDKIKIARCLESQVDTFIHTLNDYTLLLATDTINLYSRVNGVKTLLNPKDPVIKQNNDVEYYEGYTSFTFPKDKDFVVSVFQFNGSGETIIQQVPAPNELTKGTIFYCTNISTDPTNKVTLQVPSGAHIGGAQTFDILGGETVQFIGDKNEIDWLYTTKNNKSLTQDDVKSIVSTGGYIKSIPIKNDDNSVNVLAKQIQFRSPLVIGDNGDIAEINIDDVLTVTDGSTSVKVDEILFVNAKVENDMGVAKVTIPSSSGTLTVSDGATSVTGVTNFDLQDMTILSNTTDTVTIAPNGTKFVDDDKREFTAKIVKSLDKSIRISNVGSYMVDISKGKLDRNEGIHAMLGNNQLVNSKFNKARLYFADTKVKGGAFVYRDFDTKSFIIQDTDPQDDPNVSSGTTFIIGLYYEPNKELDNILTQDGKIKLMLVDENDSILIDVNGNAMGVEIDYKAGDKLKPEIYFGEIQASATTKVHLKLECDFANQEIISVGANTQICLQSITKDESGGPALDSFMLYTGYRLDVETRYYGYNSLNLARELVFPEPESTTNIGKIEFGDNLFLDTKTPVKLSIQNNNLNISDDGSNLPIFSLIKYYNPLDSAFMSGKTYKVTTTLVDKDDAFRIDLLQYTGTSTPSVPCVESYSNENPVFTTGWTSVDSLFISEDAVSGEHIQSKEFTIPDNSNALAIVMYPVERQLPINLQLRDLEGDITPWFNKVIIKNNSHISELYMLNLKEHYVGTTYTPSGYPNYRYTANSADTKVPAGVITGGDGKITNDNSWHDAGSVDPNKTQGNYLFGASGKVTMSYSARCFNEQSSINQAEFWMEIVNGSEIPNSRIATIVEANRSTPKIVKSNEFSFDVNKGDSVRILMKSDNDDGFYLQSDTNGEPLFKTNIEFNEITEDQQHVLDRLNKLDTEANEIMFMDGDKEVFNKVLQYDIGTGKITIADKI